MGGPFFMAILTLLFCIILALSIYNLILISREDYKDINETRKKLRYIRSVGVFALVCGFLGQMLGLYHALGVIEQAPEISPGVMAGGLKVSMISPLYGIIIFLVSYLFWFITDYMASKK